jgi:ribose transport system ATP-binding protein
VAAVAPPAAVAGVGLAAGRTPARACPWALRKQADEGAALVVNSSDATELAGLCDRVYVMSRGTIVRELAEGELSESAIVDSFVNVGDRRAGRRTAEANGASKPEGASEVDDGVSRRLPLAQRVLGSAWTPLAVIVLLMLVIGGYTESYTSVFLHSSNLTSLLVIALPFIVAALGQQSVLIAGGFDISIGSSMSLGVVLASFWVTSSSLAGSVPGILLCLLAGVAIGLLNAFIIRGLGVSPIIATIGTLGILEGVGVVLRPTPGGLIGQGISNALNKQVGFIPISFIVVVAVAVLAEMWLRSTSLGLSVRATGLSEESSRRTGLRIEHIKVGAYVICAVMAVAAGLFLGVQVAVGQNNVAQDYALPAFTACFLGGAALTGGRGSFIGALLGAIFLTLLINVTPLLNLPSATAQTVTGVLTIVAVAGYSLGGSSRAWGRGRGARGTSTPPAIPLATAGEAGTLENVAGPAETTV